MSGDVHDTYRWEDRSLILRWLRDPLFMPMVRALPRRLTPNQLTLLGHTCLWASSIAALLSSNPGPLLLITLAFGYTVYNLSDTLDGLYARQSGRTSRVGELLDHGLDPVSLGAVLLTYGIAMREPAWLILASTATIGYLQFVTFLHGYRVGYVVLGEIGVIEGLTLAAAVCLAGAAGGQPLLTRSLAFGVSAAGLLAIGVIAGGLPAFVSMRALSRHIRDLVPLLVLDAVIAAWYVFGDISVTTAGLLIVFTTAYQSMIVTASRLLRLPLVLWDRSFLAMLAIAAGTSMALDLDAGIQAGMAGVLAGYASFRGGRLFFRAVSRLG